MPNDTNIAQAGSQFRQILNKISNFICQSSDILPNLVTLDPVLYFCVYSISKAAYIKIKKPGIYFQYTYPCPACHCGVKLGFYDQ